MCEEKLEYEIEEDPTGLCGLRNIGNSCYLNSVVQCLTHVEPLRTYFQSGRFIFDLNGNTKSNGRLAKSFSLLMSAIWSGKYYQMSPVDLKSSIASINKRYSYNREEDAHEFTIFMLDSLHEELNKGNPKERFGEQKNDDITLTEASHAAWQNYLRVNHSVIVDHFQGQLVNVIKCSVCLYESRVFDTMMDISLSIPMTFKPNDRIRLESCIENFLAPEKLTGDQMWLCPKCKQKRNATKEIRFWRLPEILIVHLKRFTSDGKKINTFVEFPLKNFRVDNYLFGPKCKPYDLFAVVNYHGVDIDEGHYTAVCKVDDDWFMFNDDSVIEIPRRNIWSPDVYILFYENL